MKWGHLNTSNVCVLLDEVALSPVIAYDANMATSIRG